MLQSELNERHHRILGSLLDSGAMSRVELHHHLGRPKNLVGRDVSLLLEQGLVRELRPENSREGRPRVPLEIDSDTRHIVGVAIRPGSIAGNRISLRGVPAVPATEIAVEHPQKLNAAISQVLRELRNDKTWAIGVSAPGFMDRSGKTLLSSSAAPDCCPMKLSALSRIGRELPVAFDNELSAMAMYGVLHHGISTHGDVLLVYLDDESLGAAFLVNGRPNTGLRAGANELGHFALPVKTAKCYCGQIGCMERICSSRYLQQLGEPNANLTVLARRGQVDRPVMSRMMDLLATGIAGAVNFTRCSQLLLVIGFGPADAFAESLANNIRTRVILPLRDVCIRELKNAHPRTPEMAASLVLVPMYGK